jgi:Zn-finger nucleic acid-binding protein
MTAKKPAIKRQRECHRCWVPLERKEVEVFGPNIIIDVCPKCQGVWLDQGELGKLLNDRVLTNYLTKHIGTKSKSPMVCPSCGGTMDFEKADDVEVDVCLTCGGVWVDQGELDALKEKSKEGYVCDKDAKNEELFEEWKYKAQNSPLNKFFRRLQKR